MGIQRWNKMLQIWRSKKQQTFQQPMINLPNKMKTCPKLTMPMKTQVTKVNHQLLLKVMMPMKVNKDKPVSVKRKKTIKKEEMNNKKEVMNNKKVEMNNKKVEMNNNKKVVLLKKTIKKEETNNKKVEMSNKKEEMNNKKVEMSNNKKVETRKK